MTQTAQIIGPVEYRGGDGPAVEIRKGPVNVAITDIDATLSWEDENVKSAAALPIGEFRRYVESGCIRLDAAPKQRPT